MQQMEACPSTLPESSLAHLVSSLMARVDCSAASREAIVPTALAIAESFVRQVPTDGMALGLVRVSSKQSIQSFADRCYLSISQ